MSGPGEASPLGIGVIGAGRIGRLHAENLAYRVPGARLVAIADVVEAAATECAGRLGVARAHGDPAAVLADDEVEAVVICSSTDTHADLIERAAAAGKHVFCEKPVDLELARIDRAIGAADAAGVALQIGFNRRFDPSFAAVREKVAAGRVGDVHLLRITSRDPGPPPLEYVKVSGGIFLDMTIHDFDMARFLVGREVERVHALGRVRIDPAIGEVGDVDTAVITLEFEGGALGVIDNSRQAVYGYDQRVEVFGAEGVVQAENHTPNRTVVGDREGFHAPLPLHFFLERYNDSYVAELAAFVEAVRAGTPPPVTGADGRAPVVIGLAAKRSLAEGRPVALAEIAGAA